MDLGREINAGKTPLGSVVQAGGRNPALGPPGPASGPGEEDELEFFQWRRVFQAEGTAWAKARSDTGF